MNDLNGPHTASEWLVALLEKPEDADLHARWTRWLDADDRHRRDWHEIASTYEVMGQTTPAHGKAWAAYRTPNAATRPLPQAPERRARERGIRQTVRSYRPRRAVVGLGGAALAACLTLFMVSGILPQFRADFTTGTAETRSILLQDGSTIRLGPESAIDVAFTDGERNVRLLEGLAFFQVNADTARPFRVRTENVDTIVTGTAFEVRHGDNAAAVAVRQGNVNVAMAKASPPVSASPTVSEGLKAGEWIRVGWNGGVERGTLPSDQVGAWRDGRLIARDRPVGEVVAELRRYYDGLVILHGDRLARQPLTGVYSLAEPARALRAIAGAQGASVYQVSPWVLVIAGD